MYRNYSSMLTFIYSFIFPNRYQIAVLSIVGILVVFHLAFSRKVMDSLAHPPFDSVLLLYHVWRSGAGIFVLGILLHAVQGDGATNQVQMKVILWERIQKSIIKKKKKMSASPNDRQRQANAACCILGHGCLPEKYGPGGKKTAEGLWLLQLRRKGKSQACMFSAHEWKSFCILDCIFVFCILDLISRAMNWVQPSHFPYAVVVCHVMFKWHSGIMVHFYVSDNIAVTYRSWDVKVLLFNQILKGLSFRFFKIGSVTFNGML